MKMQLFFLEIFFGVSLIVLFISLVFLLKTIKQPRPEERIPEDASGIVEKKKETHLNI